MERYAEVICNTMLFYGKNLDIHRFWYFQEVLKLIPHVTEGQLYAALYIRKCIKRLWIINLSQKLKDLYNPVNVVKIIELQLKLMNFIWKYIFKKP